MSVLQFIDLGAQPNDGTGDRLRVGGDKINQNFLALNQDKLERGGYGGTAQDIVDLIGGGGFNILTTKGDLLGFTNENVRIPVGDNGFVLVADDTQPAGVRWEPQSGGGAFIPLAGTVDPVTGDIEISSASFEQKFFKDNGTFARSSFMLESEDGGIVIKRESLQNPSDFTDIQVFGNQAYISAYGDNDGSGSSFFNRLTVDPLAIRVRGDGDNFAGLLGFAYYEPTDALNYVQKQYVDSLAPTGLEAIDEGNGIGYRIIGRDPATYGNIGQNAVDFGVNSTVPTGGALGISAFNIGFDNTLNGILSFANGALNVVNGYSSAVLGTENQTGGNYQFQIGRHNLSSNSWYNIAVGYALRPTHLGELAVGVANTIKPDLNSLTDPLAVMFSVGNGTLAAGSNIAATRSDALLVRRNGEITAPSTTNAVIDNNVDGKALITKEWFTANSISGSFVPLSGTTVGNPTTGSFEFSLNQGLFFNATGNRSYGLSFGNDAMLLTAATSGLPNVALNIKTTGIEVSKGFGSGQALFGSAYYGSTYTDNSYVQKKYVDDNDVTPTLNDVITQSNGLTNEALQINNTFRAGSTTTFAHVKSNEIEFVAPKLLFKTAATSPDDFLRLDTVDGFVADALNGIRLNSGDGSAMYPVAVDQVWTSIGTSGYGRWKTVTDLFTIREEQITSSVPRPAVTGGAFTFNPDQGRAIEVQALTEDTTFTPAVLANNTAVVYTAYVTGDFAVTVANIDYLTPNSDTYDGTGLNRLIFESYRNSLGTQTNILTIEYLG